MTFSKRVLSAALLFGLSLSPNIAHAQASGFSSQSPNFPLSYMPQGTSVPEATFMYLNAPAAGSTALPTINLLGSVGIGLGTSGTPSGLLQINGSDKLNGTPLFVVTNTNLSGSYFDLDSGYQGNAYRLLSAGGIAPGGGSYARNLELQAGPNSAQFVLSTNDNIGMGTTSPDAALEMIVPTNSSGLVTESGIHIYSAPVVAANGVQGNIWIGGPTDMTFDGGHDSQFWFANNGASDGVTDFVWNGDSSHQLQINLVIANTGNVGIATSNPQTTLDVNGPIRAGSYNVVTGWGCGPEGAMGYDASNHTPVYCSSGGLWAKMGGGKPTASETITCTIGSGWGSGPCSSGTSVGTVQQTTANNHDLCVMRWVAGYAGGLWGQCVIDGNPGSTWRLTASNYNGEQVDCSMTCYDF